MLKILKILLSPTVFVFAGIMRVRNWMFDKNIFKSTAVKAKVISVGNITVGGAGKTPTVISVAKILKEAGIKVGLLSRGYRRNSKGYLLVSDNGIPNVDVDKCGDEIYLATGECQIPSAVCEKRVEGSEKLLRDVSLEAIVLDDAFQHRWIKRDLDILVFDQRFLLKNGGIDHKPLPLGVMREPLSSVDRADVVIINRKFSSKEEIPGKMMDYFEGKKVFHGYYEIAGIFDVKTHKYYDVEEFIGQNSLVVCGIAKPYSFLRILEKKNINIKNKLLFGDHNEYDEKEIHAIRKQFYETNSFSVLTTQKDAVKLINFSKELDDIDIFYLKIELKIEEEEEFRKLLMDII